MPGRQGPWPISRHSATSTTSPPGRGATSLGPDGDRLGAVDVIFLDEATGVPEWVLVRLDDGTAFVPLAGASVEERSIRVEQPRERVAGRAAARGRRDAERRRREAPLRALRARVLAGGVLDRAARGRERRRRSGPRLRKYVGAPVPAPAAEEPRTPRSRGERRGGGGRRPRPTPMAPRNLSAATPSPLPPRSPRSSRPRAASRYEVEESRGSARAPRSRSRSPARSPGLIAVLAWRRKR